MNPADDSPRGVLRKAAWRLIPFLCLLYLFNILDRTNVAFARLTMQKDLGLSDAVFDLGYGIFYLGYILFDIPANMLLRRIGARRWMARIMITWGLVSMATMAVTEPIGFYTVRILLGVAEAGFFPGIILYLTYWFPTRERARMTALFMLGIPVAGILGNPLSGTIMHFLDGVAGLRGWQWLFLVEGVPSVLLGFTVLLFLPDGPHKARWLSAKERDWLLAHLRQEELSTLHRRTTELLPALVDWRVWLLICLYFTVAVTANAGGAYAPRMINEWFPDWSKFGIGLLAALPHLCAIIAMTVISTSSDRTRERRGHVAFSAVLAAIGWSLTVLAPWPWLGLLGLCLAIAGMLSMLPTFWAMPPAFLSGAAAAGGIALINSVANIGGMIGANVLGLGGPWTMVGILLAGAILALCVRDEAALARKSRSEERTDAQDPPRSEAIQSGETGVSRRADEIM